MNALFVLCGVGVISLLAEIANVKRGLSIFIIVGLLLACILLSMNWNEGLRFYNDMVVYDNYAIAFSVLIAFTALVWYLTAKSFFADSSNKTDRSALVIFSIVGAMLMVSFNNFAILFLGIEILSISLYVLAGSRKSSSYSNEASFKYLLMGSFATGFFLFGVALVYGATGSFDVTVIAATLSNAGKVLPSFFYVGLLLVLVGMAFKMSAAPFHFWAPDVYQGSPTAITAFMSTVVKIAALGAFFKVFAVCFASVAPSWLFVLQVLMMLTLLIGNITAVYQLNVKRILAYSSIGHVGYILLAIVASRESEDVVLYYLTAYSIASVSAFSIILYLEEGGTSITLSSLQGLFYRNSLMATLLTVSLLSLAGIPPLAGFFGKYMVFATVLNNGFIAFAILGILTSLVGVYYYFGMIRSVFAAPDSESQLQTPLIFKVLFLFLLVLNFLVGLFPEPVLSLLRD